ncbi:MAG: hypothetical protein LBG15_12180 [Dysgonamonadaceae bacterium]|jgi:hypothetical protein|nr:hypothetical protein [Dysgonamonadaceae bacterium]
MKHSGIFARYSLLVNLLTCQLAYLLLFLTACGDNDNIISPDREGTNAAKFGFLPTNTAEENVKILQQGLDSLGNIYVDLPGIYDLDSAIYLNNNTKITFGKGVYIRKQRNKNGKGAEYVFINRGAYSRTYNENIEINGLNLICNGLDDNHSAIQGLVGQVSFFHVRNLTIKDFTCIDLLTTRFCVQIAEFENIFIENVYIQGNKDGIHLGVGKDFIIRNGIFKTFDDPIALNAHDYDISNPTVGWIENGLIENCYDLQNATTTGFFCRILAGSWVDWYQGMKLQKSDIAVHDGRLYRVIAPPDGKEYVSYTAPTHKSGYQTIDGINWYMMQEGIIYNGGCRNIHFKNIYLQKDRETAFSIHFDMDKWSRSYYPNSEAPVQSNLVFENIHINGKLGNLLSTYTPVDKLQFINLNWSGGNIILSSVTGLDYPSTKITLEKTHFAANALVSLVANNGRSADLEIKNSFFDPNYQLYLRGDITVLTSDVPYYFIESKIR